ncbi:MAG: hypothetical protein U5K37_05095 [Natrialbaceae archaeon]|nr:hypothetical protein [Natrialbaceae archaeon]
MTRGLIVILVVAVAGGTLVGGLAPAASGSAVGLAVSDEKPAPGNETVPHRHPDEYAESSDLAAVRAWLEDRLATQLSVKAPSPSAPGSTSWPDRTLDRPTVTDSSDTSTFGARQPRTELKPHRHSNRLVRTRPDWRRPWRLTTIGSRITRRPSRPATSQKPVASPVTSNPSPQRFLLQMPPLPRISRRSSPAPAGTCPQQRRPPPTSRSLVESTQEQIRSELFEPTRVEVEPLERPISFSDPLSTSGRHHDRRG